MANDDIPGGVVHDLPADLRDALVADETVLALWRKATPLGRNEFICWVEDAKQAATRARRIRRTCEELLEGKGRPCCWMGCVHRTDKAVSPSVQWLLDGRPKTNRKSDVQSGP